MPMSILQALLRGTRGGTIPPPPPSPMIDRTL